MIELKPKDRIIVAVDVGNAETCKELVSKLYPKIKMFKVGSQLFTAAGQEAVNSIKRRGAGCFLDLKFHDIPATVESAARSATKLGVDIFDVHASGGLEMMKSAVKATGETARKLNVKRPLILGITVLTSMNKDDLEALGIKRKTEDQVLSLAEFAKKAGLDGVVASPREIVLIKKNLGNDFLVVTPGIRPEWADKADQKRVMTPKEALERGADYIVIGRPITRARDPREAVERIIGDIG
ncbi:MAG: orotidine-5'-phosphate decarboxylase [Candidatus Omnitrophota bacterium]